MADKYINSDTAINEAICAVYWALNQHGNVNGQVIIDKFNAIPSVDIPQWISVDERLPDKNEGLVLVCMPDEFPYNTKQPYPDVEQNERIGIAHYENCVKRWWMDGYKLGDTIPIAWMPLPEPPKEDT